MKSRVADLVVAVTTIILATIYLVGTYNIRTLAVTDPLGPKAYPALIGSLMLLCGLSLAISSLRRSQNSSYPAGENGGDIKNSRPIAVGAVALWLLVYYLAYEQLGFVLATIPFLFALMAFFNRGKWLTNAIVAILFPVLLDLILSHVLGLAPAPGLFSL